MKRTVSVISIIILLSTIGVGLALNRDKLVELFNPKKDCTPYNMLVDKESKEEVIITWETKGRCTGVVKFGKDVESLDYWLSSKFIDDKNIINIDTSVYKNIRYFIIISNNEVFGLDGKAISID